MRDGEEENREDKKIWKNGEMREGMERAREMERKRRRKGEERSIDRGEER